MRLQRRNKMRREASPWSKWDDYDTTTHPDGLMRLQRRNKKGRAAGVNIKVGSKNSWMTIHGNNRVRGASPWSKWDDYDTTTHPDGLMRLQRRRQYSPPCLVGPCNMNGRGRGRGRG